MYLEFLQKENKFLCTIIKDRYQWKKNSIFMVKVGPSKKHLICFNEIHLKVMINAFYFTLKTILVLKILQILLSDKSKWSITLFQNTSIALNLAYNKKKLYKTLDHWSRDILNFLFLRKGSGNSFYTIFCVWIFKKNISHVSFC